MPQNKWSSKYSADIFISHLIGPIFLKIPAVESVHFICVSNAHARFRIMKSKDLQKIVLSKCQNGDKPTEIHRDLNDGIGIRTIKQWCQMIRQPGSISLSTPSDCPRFVRMKSNIQKVKHRLHRKEEVSA